MRADSVSVERGVRQMLAEKISGTHVGLWLLVLEHLRLGTWDLVKGWSGARGSGGLEARLGMQLIHEAVLCLNGVRQKRSLRRKGFETLNGLPFVASDYSIHELLDRHTVGEAEALQVALGKLRYARGHYPGKLVLLDPHRIQSWTKRHVPFSKAKKTGPAQKVLQSFFSIDGDSGQPLGSSLGSPGVTISQATLRLVKRLMSVLPTEALLVGDAEHFTVEILEALASQDRFTFLFPIPRRKRVLQQISSLAYTPLWAGYAVAEWEYPLSGRSQKIRAIVQRTGEREGQYEYRPFATTSELPPEELMQRVFPKRWNIEEFFNTDAALGWKRASTLNMNIRMGKLSLSLIAQAVIYQFRQKLPERFKNLTAEKLAETLFSSIDGDIRVKKDTIIVTFYNAPEDAYFRKQYENLPNKLKSEGIDPRVPWLFDFKVDFRFK